MIAMLGQVESRQVPLCTIRRCISSRPAELPQVDRKRTCFNHLAKSRSVQLATKYKKEQETPTNKLLNSCLIQPFSEFFPSTGPGPSEQELLPFRRHLGKAPSPQTVGPSRSIGGWWLRTENGVTLQWIETKNPKNFGCD